MVATLQTVAARLGLDPSTVSRAFNEPERVSLRTRRRIAEVAEELGYRPNSAARALVTGRTDTIGVVVPDVANPVFPEFVKSAQAHAWGNGQAVLLAGTDESPDREREIVKRLLRQVDGLVLCSSRLDQEEITDLAAQTHLVLVNRRFPGVSAVLVDATDGVRQAMEHLVALGHRRIVYAAGPERSWSDAERRRLLAQQAERLRIDLVVVGPFVPTHEGGAGAAEAVRATGATAVVAYNDLMALGIQSALAVAGVAVPDDMSVMGVDDISTSAISTPALTTIRVSMGAAGEASARLMAEVASGAVADPTVVTLSTQLVVRASTGHAPSATSVTG
ncbi:HTH-type transcriptional regulator GalS [Cellulomonas sp. T2.31MG-18]|uniref:LacI family DNA-binding transcriptional regulator n=1 Tax=Cellulomonas sp. T2.31MG-18 TaxID=3157619 RepID=UPI0035E60304